MTKAGDEDAYSEAETIRRREAALKKMLSTPHQPHKPVGKGRKKPSQNPAGPKSSGA